MLARQRQRAGQLFVDGYRFKGKQVRGTATRSGAPRLVPGQYLDSIGPGEERYYATDLDAVSTADFSAAVVPQPGAAIGTLDMLRTRIVHGTDISCDATFEMFGQHGGATPLTSGVSRIPTQCGSGGCDKAGRYWLVVERKAAKGSDAARWPMELMFHVEHQMEGRHARAAGAGVRRGRQGRRGAAEFSPQVPYTGRLAPLMGTVPAAWSNRYESHPGVIPVHRNGDFSLAVTLGAKASEVARQPQIGVVLRIAVLGKEKSGPQAGASALRADVPPGDSRASADGTQDGGGGWSTGRVVAVAIGGVGVLLMAGLAASYGRARGKPRAGSGNSDPRRGGSW